MEKPEIEYSWEDSNYEYDNIDTMYLNIAFEVALRSKCNRKKVGCVLVKDGNILSFGYNGTPSGMDNECEDCNGNTKKEVLHAETNAITKCAKSGHSTEGSTCYLTYSPCFECAKLMIQSGIKRVFFTELYRDTTSLSFLNEAGIKIIYLPR